MFVPRFAAVVFVALLGIVNVAGLPLWPEVRPLSLYLFGCVEPTDGFVSVPYLTGIWRHSNLSRPM